MKKYTAIILFMFLLPGCDDASHDPEIQKALDSCDNQTKVPIETCRQNVLQKARDMYGPKVVPGGWGQ